MILSIINQKGGVGKTTTTFNLAYLLLEKGYDVLAIDIDIQGNLTNGFNINPLDVAVGTYEVLLGKDSIYNGLQEIETKNDKSLYVLPTNLNLVMAENEISGQMARELVLKNLLKEVKEDFDFILIDCPPSLNNLSTNAIVTSDYLIIPSQTDYLSYKGLELLLDNVSFIKKNFNEELQILGVISTFKEHTNHSNEVQELLDENYEVLGIIPRAVVVKNSFTDNKPIFKVDPKHESNIEYEKIADKIIERKNNNE